jgi:hypothetical protein
MNADVVMPSNESMADLESPVAEADGAEVYVAPQQEQAQHARLAQTVVLGDEGAYDYEPATQYVENAPVVYAGYEYPSAPYYYSYRYGPHFRPHGGPPYTTGHNNFHGISHGQVFGTHGSGGVHAGGGVHSGGGSHGGGSHGGHGGGHGGHGGGGHR